MAIPWLIGAAVVWGGKKIYDSIEEDDRREKAQRNARIERREIEEEATKKREAAIKEEHLRIEAENKKSQKNYIISQAKVLLDKYEITQLSPNNLGNLAISDPSQASTRAIKSYMESRINKALKRDKISTEIELAEIVQLELFIKGL